MAKGEFSVIWAEDGTAYVRGRLTAPDGSGAATGVAGEGNWLEAADFSSISYKVFENGVALVGGEGSLTPAAVIEDVPITSTANWTKDSTGHNFAWVAPHTLFPVGGATYRVEIKSTLTGGTVFWGTFEGVARPVSTS